MGISRNRAPLAAVADPLLASVELGYRAEFYPYGFPAAVSSNSPLPLEAARESWGGMAPRYREQPLEIRCLISPGQAPDLAPPTFRVQRHLVAAVVDAENFWSSDMMAGFAFASATTAMAGSADYFRHHFLEGMAGSLLAGLHVANIHAACVSLDGHGVLLAGDSGAGKSSLSYACARRGWTYTTDDAAVMVRRETGSRVIGNPSLFRFRGGAGSLFPEFCCMQETRRAGGKPTIEVRSDSLPDIRTAAECHVDHVVFLDRRETARVPKLLEVSPEDALRRLIHYHWSREIPAYREHQIAARRLLNSRLVEMRYRSLDSAVDLLERLIKEK